MKAFWIPGAIALLFSSGVRADVKLTLAHDGGHWVLPAYVNGKGPFPFVLDTGADECGFYRWFAVKEKLAVGPSQQLGGMTGDITAPTYRADSVRVDGHEIHHVMGDGIPDRHDAGIQAGVAGNDLMDGTITIFDFPSQTVKIIPKPTDVASLVGPNAVLVHGGTVKDGTQLTLPVSINGAEAIAVLDTGSRDTEINYRFAKAAGLHPESATFMDGDVLYGANSIAMRSRRGPIGTLRFAGMVVQGAKAKVMDLAVFASFGFGDKPAMILGLNILQNFRLVYDHQAKQFWVTKSSGNSSARNH